MKPFEEVKIIEKETTTEHTSRVKEVINDVPVMQPAVSVDNLPETRPSPARL